MSLTLEIEYLSGVSFAAISPDSDAPDWPPQPDRVFSALVASWAARGGTDEEREALAWLETLSVPRLIASDAEARIGAVFFVPPNDPRSDRQKNAKGVLPAMRSRQPRRFPAARPYDPVIQLCWPEATPDQATLSALQNLARDTAYVGHSASLTRCRFLVDHSAAGLASAKLPQRRIYQGRLEELRQAYVRFEKSADKKDRPQKGARVQPEPEASAKRLNLFGAGEHWLILERVVGEMPDIRACALVAKTLRDALLAGYQRIGLENEIPEVVSGHAADGTPTRAPHLAVIPLAFAGFPYADGHVMGFALIPPADSEILTDSTFRKALRSLSPIDEQRGRRILTLTSKPGTPSGSAFSINLSPTFEPPPGKRSLDPALYTGPARVFATVTPIVLDRHLKEKGAARQEEIAAQVVASCRNIGLPEPKAIVVDKHSAVEGAPSAYPSGNSPRWMNWRLPPSLVSRQLTHAVIRFAEPVQGPVILGAGRFVGLGLCLPIDGEGVDAHR
jgi:CRISPR-associated protein Csb2